MRGPDTVSQLTAFEARGPGTDAERRAARWLADELARAGRQSSLEPFWCRPNWAFAHAWHVALALAGSLVSTASAQTGIVLLAIALVSIVADHVAGNSFGRRLTPERASQNVVAPSPELEPKPVRLVILANYDAGRMGWLNRDALRGFAARFTRFSPGWLGWLAAAILWLLVTALLRAQGHTGAAIGVVQLLPTVGLVLLLAALLETAGARFSPAANDDASGVAVALDLVRALDVAPPRNLAVELVLEGAGEGGRIGSRRYLRSRREELGRPNTVVLGFAACGAGRPRWWVSDGQLVPLRYSRALRDACATVAQDVAHLGPAPRRGRGATPAWRACAKWLPAVAIGCLDERGIAPRSHQPTDVPDTVDPTALTDAVEFGLVLVDAIDAAVGQRRSRKVATPA